MFKWKEDFVGNTQKKCVYVNHNGDFDHGKGTFHIFKRLEIDNLCGSYSALLGARLGIF
jgi:hypothetical protein